MVVTWPNGRIDEARKVATGKAYWWREGEGLKYEV
jgi:hypothetical protein